MMTIDVQGKAIEPTQSTAKGPNYQTVSVDGELLKKAIRIALVAADVENGRWAINSIAFVIHQGKLFVVGTDGRRLHWTFVEHCNYSDDTWMIELKSAKEVVKSIKSKNKKVKIGFPDKLGSPVLIGSVSANQAEGRYPKVFDIIDGCKALKVPDIVLEAEFVDRRHVSRPDWTFDAPHARFETFQQTGVKEKNKGIMLRQVANQVAETPFNLTKYPDGNDPSRLPLPGINPKLLEDFVFETVYRIKSSCNKVAICMVSAELDYYSPIVVKHKDSTAIIMPVDIRTEKKKEPKRSN